MAAAGRRESCDYGLGGAAARSCPWAMPAARSALLRRLAPLFLCFLPFLVALARLQPAALYCGGPGAGQSPRPLGWRPREARRLRRTKRAPARRPAQGGRGGGAPAGAPLRPHQQRPVQAARRRRRNLCRCWAAAAAARRAAPSTAGPAPHLFARLVLLSARAGRLRRGGRKHSRLRVRSRMGTRTDWTVSGGAVAALAVVPFAAASRFKAVRGRAAPGRFLGAARPRRNRVELASTHSSQLDAASAGLSKSCREPVHNLFIRCS